MVTISVSAGCPIGGNFASAPPERRPPRSSQPCCRRHRPRSRPEYRRQPAAGGSREVVRALAFLNEDRDRRVHLDAFGAFGDQILPRIPSSTASTSIVGLSVSISASVTGSDLSPSFLTHL